MDQPPEPTTQLLRRQLRLLLLSTVLLGIPQLGRIWHPTILFEFVGLFSVPTGLIITGAIVWSVRRRWSSHRLVIAAAVLNLVVAAALVPLMLR